MGPRTLWADFVEGESTCFGMLFREALEPVYEVALHGKAVVVEGYNQISFCTSECGVTRWDGAGRFWGNYRLNRGELRADHVLGSIGAPIEIYNDLFGGGRELGEFKQCRFEFFTPVERRNDKAYS